MSTETSHNNDDTPSSKEIIRSVISIISFGVLGFIGHLIFDWNIWWSIGIGIIIGWFLPGFIDGAKESIQEANKEPVDEDKNRTDG
ncbi:MAG: hypothetical protein J1F20_01370 [Muribaculaceae bacterium]|nr:hypothetical protein [Muribaculaceae bacterium]